MNGYDIMLNFLVDAWGIEWSWPALSTRDVLTGLVLAGFAGLLAVEARLARGFHRGDTARQSYRTNVSTFLFNDLVMSLLSVSSLLTLAEGYGHFGLLSGLEDPLPWGLLAFVLLDLALYLWHKAMHSFDSLWFFHRVHHSDRSVNVSTAFRLHAGEVVLTTVVKAAFIVAVGVDAATVAAHETLITLFVMFHHANIAFRAERWLAWLIVVPSLHRLHHSMLRAEHDRNYGFVFSLWDRLFRTLDRRRPAAVGLKYVPTLSFPGLLRYGFTRLDTAPAAQAVRTMIAEAAYYKAERRGFAPGWELHDWLEAEREISIQH
jgi:sterol desaturase/sphingolipid hydroxylase (fatty acid hydroxylase superfamily)